MSEALLTSAEIRSAFSVPLAPIKATAGYRIRLLGVLLGLAALQALYLLLIAFILLLTWVYLKAALGSGITLNLATLIFYIGPPSVGIIATLFLLKPLLIRPPRPPKPIRLLPDAEPVVFEFIERLSRTLGSPQPSRVYVDLQVNAAAAIRGWRGFFFGHMDLTIGLPLAAALSLQEFSGVLAHELGHFSQRAGLRSYFLIQTIRSWFARVVHQRDSWDDWLAHSTDNRDWRITIVAALATAVVSGSRRYLALLMRAGGWLSVAFSRDMEFDADRHEAALVGPDVFEQTLRRLPLLSCSATLSWQDATKAWSLGRLPEDIAALTTIRASFLPQATSDHIVQQIMAETTGRWDTHPCASDRIASVRRTAPAGSLALDGATGRLFHDLPGLCRQATRHHYEKILVLSVDSSRLVPIEETIVSIQVAREFESAAQQLFHAPSDFCSRWFRLPPGVPRDQQTTATASTVEPKFEASVYEDAVQTNKLHFAALVIRQAGVAVDPPGFRLHSSDLAAIQAEEATSSRHLRDAIREYCLSAEHLAERIETTVARLLGGKLAVTVKGGRKMAIPNPLSSWNCYSILSQCQDDVMEIRRNLFAVGIIRDHARLFRIAACANLLDELQGRALALIKGIIARTAEAPAVVIFNPKSAETVGAQLALPLGSPTETIQSFLARFDALSSQALSHLAWFVISACSLPEGSKSAQAGGES